MHNNSPRMGIPPKSQTSPSIGPNTYIICDERSKLKNRVAFLSTEEKDPKFIRKTFCDTFYSVSDCSNIKLGSSPRNKASRFTYREDGAPGPGDYDPEAPGCPSASKRPPTRGRLYVCRIPFTLKGGGPSVPTQVNENGYFLDGEGNVVPVPPDERVACFFYDVVGGPSCGDRYRGCKWSERTAKRSFASPEDGPGPAEYDVGVAPGRSADIRKNDGFRQMARLLTFLPRHLDAQEVRLRKENMPGPGHYDISTNRAGCKICPGIFPKPFIRGSARFGENPPENPSPAAYDVAGCPKLFRASWAPFQVGATRFPKRKSARTPGPAEYDVEGRPKMRVTDRAPFNNSASRGWGKDGADSPSPADYYVGGGKKCRILVSSVFRSKVNRFPKRCPKSIHPFFENNSVNKAFTSHNLKIMEEILRTPLRYHTTDTREKWSADLKKRKRLRCFVNDGKVFSHCS